MEKKYQALRVIGTIFKIMGVVVGILAVLMALLACIGVAGLGTTIDAASASSGYRTGGLGASISAVAGVIYAVMLLITLLPFAVMLFAAGEGLFLLIDLEHNTRRTMLLLEGRVVQAAAAPPGQPGV